MVGTNAPANDDDDDPMEPADRDFALLAEYITGNMSPEQETVVEERLVADEAFFKMMQFVMQFMNTRVNLAAELGLVPPPLPDKKS